MSVLEITPEIDEQQRREAVFLIPLDPLSLSEDYYQTRHDLLDDGSGVIFKQHVNQAMHQGQVAERAIDSLIFDASEQEKGRYVWQLTRGSFGSRTISQVVISEAGIEGWTFSTDSQGALQKADQIDNQARLGHLWGQIQEVILGDNVAEYEAKLREEKLKAIAMLSEFMASRKITIEIPSYADDKRQAERREVVVDGEKFKTEEQNLSEAVRRVGFTMLRAFKPPKTDFKVADPTIRPELDGLV
jgi:hypothetical protein